MTAAHSDQINVAIVAAIQDTLGGIGICVGMDTSPGIPRSQTSATHLLTDGRAIARPTRASQLAFESKARWLYRALDHCLRMISAQTRSAFVARENRCTLFRIMR